ncbi:NAD(P)-binding protein [Glonium stellatum]|uniref:NAD(P)-binding protein n=1 Tax=Glonium stellatum TaxID=574774 RepID=A0A8E2ET30_9PEZI|nr:NAD(P)-binding protein [Glonium stellatum]
MTSKETVLITGCSDGGIGSALAFVLQQRGLHVFATARDLSKISSLKGFPNVTLLTLDVTEPSHIKVAVEAVAKETGGKLDFLISNAGRNHFMPIIDKDISIRALEIIADTLRLELAPFGVDVLSVVIGGVKTKGQTYFEDFVIPETSRCKAIEETIASRARGIDGMPRMELMEYATEVAGEILKRTAGRFWWGQNAEAVKMSTTSSVPQSILDAGAVMGSRLETLKK